MSKDPNLVEAKSSVIYRPAPQPIILALTSEDLDGLNAALQAKKSFIVYGGDVPIQIERRTSYWINRKGRGDGP